MRQRYFKKWGRESQKDETLVTEQFHKYHGIITTTTVSRIGKLKKKAFCYYEI